MGFLLYGTVAEWFRRGSAKPLTLVRIQSVPLNRKEMEIEEKIVLIGTYKGSYEKFRPNHTSKRKKIKLSSLLSKLLKRRKNG
jgi:hypothetical protein